MITVCSWLKKHFGFADFAALTTPVIETLFITVEDTVNEESMNDIYTK